MAKSKELNPIEATMLRLASESNGQGTMPDFDAEFSASFPALWAFLTWKEVGDYNKAPGKLSLAVDGTAWRLSYYDPAARRGCSVRAVTLMQALACLDKALVDPNTPWTGGKSKSGWTRKKE